MRLKKRLRPLRAFDRSVRPIVLRQHGHANGSGSILAKALDIRSSSPMTRRKTAHNRFVINWGNSSTPAWSQRGILWSNRPLCVGKCSNKILTFQDLLVARVPTLEWELKKEDVIKKGWLEKDGKVIVRNIVNGHSGAGIRVIRKGEEIPDAPLYTRYFRKHAEYRVHVAYDEVILIQQKRRDSDYAGNDPNDSVIRTHDRGWVFCINDLGCDSGDYREALHDLAKRAVRALGLNHAAVDILVKHSDKIGTKLLESVVCEINSAPALRAGSTLECYTRVFRDKIAAIRQWDRTKQDAEIYSNVQIRA